MEPLKYITYAPDLEELRAPRTAVDTYGVRWLRVPSGWVDDALRYRTSAALHTMRGPVYLLPEDFTGSLNLDDLADAEPGDYVMDDDGDLWGLDETRMWVWNGGREDEQGPLRREAQDLMSTYGPLLPAPRPGDTYIPPPVSAMEAAAREEEARPVGFWRRLWNGLVWG